MQTRFAPRERRRYSARIPESAWLRGRAPGRRARRREALRDIAAGLERHLRDEHVNGSRSEWAAWAARLAADAHGRPAPDGTEWSITTHIDYD